MPRNGRPTTRAPVERLVSAGGVVYRVRDGTVEVVLCGRREPPRWSLPKGTPDPGETLEETALREVHEETGLEPRMVGPLQSIEYWFVRPDDRVRCHKTVHFYLMESVGGDTSLHDPEFDVVEWLPAEEALRRLTYANEARVLERALAVIAQSHDARRG